MSMPLVEALEVIRDLRDDAIVVTTMGAAREFPKLSQSPLDLHYIPSAMGQAPALGLGLALAQPARQVIVLNGDGCMLMNLGVLVTIAASEATNLTLIVLNNGLYEVTGGQRLVSRNTTADFTALAHAAGLSSAVSFSEIELWRERGRVALTAPGPRFVELRVAPVGMNYHLESPGPISERLANLRAALASSR